MTLLANFLASWEGRTVIVCGLIYLASEAISDIHRYYKSNKEGDDNE